jgi:hypothetical protein
MGVYEMLNAMRLAGAFTALALGSACVVGSEGDLEEEDVSEAEESDGELDVIHAENGACTVSGSTLGGSRPLCAIETSGTTLTLTRVFSDEGYLVCDQYARFLDVGGFSMSGSAGSGPLGLCAVTASGSQLDFFQRRDDGDGVILCDQFAGSITLSGATASGGVTHNRGICQVVASASGLTFYGLRIDDPDVSLPVCDDYNAGTITLTCQ